MNSAGEGLLFAVQGPLARLTLNRPEKRNALDRHLVDELKVGLRRAAADPAVRVVTVGGAGKDFCAGADLGELRRATEASVAENFRDVERLAELFRLIRAVPKPVVALVQGRALAGGCGLATACDLVLASDSASFGYPEIHIGFVPALVMAILRRNVSEKRAFELVVGGDPIPASEAERLGLVNRVFPDARFAEEADRYVLSLADRSASAVQLAKRLLYQQDGLTFEGALAAGASVNVLARLTDDVRAGVEHFLAGRGRTADIQSEPSSSPTE